MKLSPEERREKMVRDQIRSRGITSERVIRAMLKVPRHLFISPDCNDMAYGDHPVSIGHEQTISQPYMVASMTELLELEPHHKVLEIGTGSGYQTAVLCELGMMVYTMERIDRLADKAEEILLQAGYQNFQIIRGDGTLGSPEHAPYERIIVTASSPDIPENLLAQLAPDGIMIIPVGREDLQYLYRLTRSNDGITKEKLYGCRFVKLIGKQGWF